MIVSIIPSGQGQGRYLVDMRSHRFAGDNILCHAVLVYTHSG